MLIQALLVPIALIANGPIEKQPFAALGYRWGNIKKQLLWAAALLAILSAMFIGLPLLFGARDIFPARDSLWFAVPDKLVFVGFAEETMFRGYMLNAFNRLTGSKIAAVALSSLLFGFWHFIGSGDLLQVAMTAVIGLIIAIPCAYARNCSTLSAALAHGAYGAFLSVLTNLDLSIVFPG
ncbi:MAG: CPBP family intramembrane metalloprotease [Firmicutes bacterium]|nr:CPBP family intramembrane metalloprotease [Bacillota bacterium]